MSQEAGGWHAVALTLTGTPDFARDFVAGFGAAAGDEPDTGRVAGTRR